MELSWSFLGQAVLGLLILGLILWKASAGPALAPPFRKGAAAMGQWWSTATQPGRAGRVKSALSGTFGQIAGLLLLAVLVIEAATHKGWDLPGHDNPYVVAVFVWLAGAWGTIMWIVLACLVLFALCRFFKKPAWWIGWLALALVLCTAVPSIMLAVPHGHKEHSRSPVAAAQDSNTARPDGVAAENSPCMKFSLGGASCQVRTDSGWIRPRPGTPAGLTFCWNPESRTGAFARIQYLDEGGVPHDYVPGQPPEHAVAYRYYPSSSYLEEHGISTLTIDYYLYDGQCPAD